MPNLYATPTEIQASMPNVDFSSVTTYNAMLYRLSERISRLIDKFCNRVFYPTIATRYFEGDDSEWLWLRDDLFSITSVSYSTDYGTTYTALTENTDFVGQPSKNMNGPQSYACLRIVPASGASLGAWPTGFKSLKVIGTWGYGDRSSAWEDSQDTVQDNPLGTSATSITVSDVDGSDKWGISPRFAAGNVLLAGSEIIEVTATNTGSNKITAVRAVNGSTAAQHAQNVEIDVWRPPELVKQACITEATRVWERMEQGFADGRANIEVGQFAFVKSLDPLTQELLAGLVRVPMA